MQTKDASVEKIRLDKPLYFSGLSKKSSGLPDTFESLGKLWGIFNHETVNKIENQVEPAVQAAIMAGGDYIVGCQTDGACETPGITGFTIPAGEYVKGAFSADDFEELVDGKLQTIWADMSAWAEERGIVLNESFAAEIYPQDTVKLERPEMYCLWPVEGTDL